MMCPQPLLCKWQEDCQQEMTDIGFPTFFLRKPSPVLWDPYLFDSRAHLFSRLGLTCRQIGFFFLIQKDATPNLKAS